MNVNLQLEIHLTNLLYWMTKQAGFGNSQVPINATQMICEVYLNSVS